MTQQVNAEDYVRFAAAVKGADKAVARAIRKRVREAAKPIGDHVITKGSDSMPSRGGLQSRLKSVRPTVSILARGASINLRKGANFTSLNAGTLRHPLYGHGPWQQQGVPSGTYTGAFADLPPGQRAALDLTITDAMKELGL